MRDEFWLACVRWFESAWLRGVNEAYLDFSDQGELLQAQWLEEFRGAIQPAMGNEEGVAVQVAVQSLVV